jgi:ABC-type uncharacterized transport system permease subunit
MILAPEYSFRRSVKKGFVAVGLTLLTGVIWSVAQILSPRNVSLLLLPVLQWALVVGNDWRRHHDD